MMVLDFVIAIAIIDEYQIDPHIVAALIMAESGGDVAAISPRGAVGLMQVIPMAGRPTRSELLNPYVNLRAGCEVLREYLDYHDGDYRLALAAYNLGIVGLERAGGIDGDKAQLYISRITESWRQLFPHRLLPWEDVPTRIGGPMP
jgi:soluble lytic murein transglycosylase-like protein